MTPLETIAVIFTLANVWLAVKENIWSWPAGIVSVVLYGFVNYHAKLYSNAALQLVYLGFSIHGWYEWLHGGENRTELHISRTSPRAWRWCIVAGTLGTLALLVVLRQTSDASLPIWDASTTAVSLVAQWMLNEKLVENWILWVIVDVIYVPLYAFQKLYLTAGLYAIFCWMAWKGYVDWRRSMRQRLDAEAAVAGS